ncbi:sulfatase [Luteolibacter ambystomatis]|uniref:Sulfatase n=1 Tax=Luteolibacter ambystomatis TaxID=2824561 RepID=A0A975J0T6_9BACT|nr:sulfatase [Luteolibacter ambystomatis]QUE51933.1 sulfatase [Luteolibacter ambystomatis]
MLRLTFVRIFLAISLLSTVGAAWGVGAEEAPAGIKARPNMLFFIADNWAFPHAGILGDKTAETPAFDRLAREGVLFTHVFNASPICSPTRASILTGRPPHQLGEAGNLWGGFPGSLKVFTRMLEDAGYEVGFCGKPWAPGRYKPYGWSMNPVGREYKSFTDFLAVRDPAKPFFFWIGNVDTALRDAFQGWNYDEESVKGIDASGIVVPPQLPDTPEIRRDIQAYYGGVRKMDRALAGSVGALDQARLLDETVVVCTSDNGWQMPRGLANCYDAGSRVPLAVRWGSHLKAGRRVDDFISGTDFTATFLELAGLSPTAEMTSRSFVDLLLGRQGGKARDAAFIERERHANVRRGNLSYPMRAIRTERFLYIRNLRPDRWPAGDPQVYFDVGDYGDVDASAAKNFLQANIGKPGFQRYDRMIFEKRPEEELYDLVTDPAQVVNVAGQERYAAAQQDLRNRLDRWMRETSDPRIDPSCDPWDHYPYYAPGVLNGKKAAEPYAPR